MRAAIRPKSMNPPIAPITAIWGEVLEKAVENLPEDQKAVVMLRDYEGYSYREIADITGLSESQVKVYIYRARVYLKSYIGSLEQVI